MRPENALILIVALVGVLCLYIEAKFKKPDFERCPLCNQPESLVFRF